MIVFFSYLSTSLTSSTSVLSYFPTAWSIQCSRLSAVVNLRLAAYYKGEGGIIGENGIRVWFGLVFWGALFPRTADPIFHESLCLHPPTARLCPKILHLDLVIPLPEGDSIQVLQAVSFWKRERY